MEKALQIGVIGRVLDSLCDGQTIKTRVLVKELKKRYPDCRIHMAETGDYRSNPMKLVWQLIQCVRKSDVIFVLLAENGLRVILPILFFLNRFYRKPVLHDCIGGNHWEMIRDYPGLRKYYARMEVNWVETERLKKSLEKHGLFNAEVLPNFKDLTPVKPEALALKQEEPFRFCTFSRVIREKGITAAAEAVRAINREKGCVVCTLDVYGPVEEPYREEFEQVFGLENETVRYMGVAKFDESVAILKDYYMLLFPTTFWGEGFPGTVIDAFSAGLPVIATDWHCNSEILDHGRTGFLYSPDQPEMLKNWMEEAMADPRRIHEMGLNCLEELKKYSPETLMETIHQRILKVTK